MKITTKHRRFIVSLLQQPTIKKAATASGISERTGHNWLDDKDFQNELAKAEAEVLRAVSARFASAAGDALDALLTVLKTTDSDKHKISAARGVLAALPNVRLLGSIEQRLNELEQNQ